MEAIKAVGEDESVLLTVLSEREKRIADSIRLYEGMIRDDSAFNLAKVRFDDEIVLGLYDYLLNEYKGLGLVDESIRDSKRYERIKKMLGELENLQVVQYHMEGKKQLPASEEALIDDTVRIIGERQAKRRSTFGSFFRNRKPKAKVPHILAKKFKNQSATKGAGKK